MNVIRNSESSLILGAEGEIILAGGDLECAKANLFNYNVQTIIHDNFENYIDVSSLNQGEYKNNLVFLKPPSP